MLWEYYMVIKWYKKEVPHLKGPVNICCRVWLLSAPSSWWYVSLPDTCRLSVVIHMQYSITDVLFWFVSPRRRWTSCYFSKLSSWCSAITISINQRPTIGSPRSGSGPRLLRVCPVVVSSSSTRTAYILTIMIRMRPVGRKISLPIGW